MVWQTRFRPSLLPPPPLLRRRAAALAEMIPLLQVTDAPAPDSSAFWTISFLYVLLAVAAAAVNFGLKAMGRNRYAPMVCVLIALTVVCMWMLWAVTWLMQWHPLIAPIKDVDLF